MRIGAVSLLLASLIGPAAAEEVLIPCTQGDLGACLDLPKGPGAHPVLVIVPGSGPATRDFPLYAALARHGVETGFAVLRYDKRGAGRSAGDWASEGFEARAKDVREIVAWLGKRPDIRKDRILLCGHSQGGWIAPLAASQDPGVAGLVILAGAAVTPAEQDLSSTRQRMCQMGFSEKEAEEAVAFKRLLHHAAGPEAVEDLLKTHEGKPWMAKLIPPGTPTKALWDALRHLALIGDHQPIPVLEQVRCPVLALFGEKDPFVPSPENLEPMRKALLKGGKDVTVTLVPGAGHCFEGKSGAFAEGFLKEVDGWLASRFGPGR